MLMILSPDAEYFTVMNAACGEMTTNYVPQDNVRIAD